jgi:hypothetical protein
VTRLLEGDFIPTGLASLLAVNQARHRDRLSDRYNALVNKRTTIPRTPDVGLGLKRDRDVGARLGVIRDANAITRAETAINDLSARRLANLSVSVDQFSQAHDALSEALRANCAEESLLIDRRQAADAARLDQLHTELIDRLAPYALDAAEQRESQANEERQRLFSERELAPTRLGNDAAAVRAYCETRYGIAFDFFWPRFLIVMQKDAKVTDVIATAKIHLDFSIMMFTLITVSVLVWAGALWLFGRSIWTAILVLWGGPLIAMIWLQVVHASYANFAEIVRSAVDLYRFDLLDALRLPRPLRSDDEKRLWEAAARLTLLNEHKHVLTFRYAPK